MDQLRIADHRREQVYQMRVTGKHQELISTRQLREGRCGAFGAVGVEVDQHLVDNYRQTLALLAELADKSEPDREI